MGSKISWHSILSAVQFCTCSLLRKCFEQNITPNILQFDNTFKTMVFLRMQSGYCSPPSFLLLGEGKSVCRFQK